MARCVVPGGRVVAVEPNPPVASQLRSTVDKCFAGQVQVIQAGIAGSLGTGYLKRPAHGFSVSVEVDVDSDAGESLVLTTVDALAEKHLAGRVPDFIKVDIEGNEVYLVTSMQYLLESGARPALLVEFHPEKCSRRGGSAEAICMNLRSWGYQYRHVERSGNGYRLHNEPMEALGHENLLFVVAEYLPTRPRLAAQWDLS
jgi:FkbM family methyltransferase